MLPSQILSLLFLPEWVASRLPWYLAGAVVVLGLFVFGRRDLLRFSARRVLAIAHVCYTEAVRRRVLWVTPLAILGVVVVAQLSRPADGQDAIRQATKFCLFASGLLVTVTAVILACTNLPREIENRVIYSVVTKPVTRLEIVLGKVLGFASISGTIILIMGAFTYAFLEIASHSEAAQVRRQLESLPSQSTLRPALQHYADMGFLGTRSLEVPARLEILGRPPQGPGKTKWMQGSQGEYFLVPFDLTADQKDLVLDAADRGSLLIMTTLRIEQRQPDEEEQKVIRQMQLAPAIPAKPAKGGSPATGPAATGPAATVPATSPSTINPATAPAAAGPATAPAGPGLASPPAEPAAEVVGPPQPEFVIRVLDERRAPILGGSDTGAGETVSLIRPDKPGDAWFAPFAVPAEALKKMGAAGKFYVQVTARSPATDYGADAEPVALIVPVAAEAPQFGPSISTAGAPAGKLIKISPAPDKADPSRPSPPEFFSFAARKGMRLTTRAGGTGPLAVYHFDGAPVRRPDSGKIPLQVQVNVERNGDMETGAGYALVTIEVVNRKTGRTSAPIEFAPELNQTRYIDVPFDLVEGGDFDVLIRGQTNNLWLGVAPESVALVTADQTFLVNLVKSLLLLWLLSLLVVIVAVFTSTFFSWPIAVICTLIVLLGHWVVEQLGDALRSGIGHQLISEFGGRSGAVNNTLAAAFEDLAAVLRFISQFLPDVSRFPVTEYIERGVSIPVSALAGALGVLCCFGLPLLVLSYVILRKKEVAP